MMVMKKTADLAGAALDWAVANCEGMSDGLVEKDGRVCRVEEWDPEKWAWRDSLADWMMWIDYAPSQRWDQGGPLIEREMISITHGVHEAWHATKQVEWKKGHMATVYGYGPTPLVAAMRCHVGSVKGEDIEIPKELE